MALQTLLTGFGPFITVLSNPTGRLVERFEQETVSGHEISTCLLPTSFRRAPEMMDAALERGGRDGRPFDLVLMLGVAQNSPGWRVERYGRNWNNACEDVDGYIPDAGPILASAPEALTATLPTEDLVAALHRAGLPAVASDSAGGYLCNHILFHTLFRLQEAGSATRAGFLHVPADELTCAPEVLASAPSTFAQQVAAVRAVLEVLTVLPQRPDLVATGA
jgi:pyroglutamyl-peptidase